MLFLYIGYFLGIVSGVLFTWSFFLEEPVEYETFYDKSQRKLKKWRQGNE